MKAGRVEPGSADELLGGAEKERIAVMAEIDGRARDAIDPLLQEMPARMECLPGVGVNAEPAGAFARLGRLRHQLLVPCRNLVR